MRCLITGATGFIGSYLCDYLQKKGHTVVALSRNVPDLFVRQFQLSEAVSADLTSPDLAKLRIQADVMIHLAAANDIVSKDSKKGIELSAFGTKNALDLAVRNGIQQFIFFSTFQVYGTELTGAIDESTPIRPENDYAINHVFGEKYVEMYAQMGRIQAAIVRPTNIYGPMLSATVNRWSLVPGCFCKEALEKGTITLLSSGKQKRNFISLEEVAQATESVMRRFPSRLDTVNFATSCTLSIKDMAQITKRVYNDMYNATAEIIVKSSDPLTSNEFTIYLDKLHQYGVGEIASKMSMEAEIRKLFRLLKSGPR